MNRLRLVHEKKETLLKIMRAVGVELYQYDVVLPTELDRMEGEDMVIWLLGVETELYTQQNDIRQTIKKTIDETIDKALCL